MISTIMMNEILTSVCLDDDSHYPPSLALIKKTHMKRNGKKPVTYTGHIPEKELNHTE